jgi:eukaryotic-like serine/threonine-protein kinase
MTVANGLLPDRYAAPHRIGRGGMGEIFRATDTVLGRDVAIKVLDERYARSDDVRRRFTREALAVARLSGNANIVTIYDVGEEQGRPFIVMEYLAGGSLADRIRDEGVQPPGRAFDWLEQAAGALDAAHRAGVIHRDVKPANLLLDRHDRVHVADFGIASAAGLDSFTQTGTVLGTASYLSPEQAQGAPTSPASDLYSLAVVAFELLTGSRPFEGDSVAAEAAAHVTGEVPSVCDVDPSLPCELDPVFRRALAKDPRDRYATCAEFVAALRSSLADAAGTTSLVAPPVPPPARRDRSPWLLPLLGAALVAGIVAAAALALTGGSSKHSAPPPPRVSVKTVTQPGTTVVRTETAPAATTTPTTTPTTTAAQPSTSDPYALNNQAWELMKQGNYAAALPLLQQAVSALGDRTDLGTAYANYNLGYTLIRLGQCSEAMPYLEKAKSIEPSRHEVHDAIKEAKGCSG